MKEKLKSALLIVLVAGSLMQSYMLAYNQPNFIPIRDTEYIRAELAGAEMGVEDVVFPSEMILHFGEERHTLLYPKHYFYEEIYEMLTERSFQGVRPIARYMNDWNAMRNERKGLEITFHDGLPFSVLRSLFRIEGEVDHANDHIDRIWLTATEREGEVKAYFFADRGFNAYEAARVDMSAHELARYVELGSYLNELNNFSLLYGKYYVPEQPLHIPIIELPYSTLTPQQMQNSLFIDPSISRNLLERDGTEIFTDGKRGLQIDRMNQWMNYSDPVAPAPGRAVPEESFLTAMQFINQHGGWNGSYTTDMFNQEWTQVIQYRQYYDSYPIFSLPGTPFGYMRIVLQQGVVSNYERSLITLDYEASPEREEYLLAGGESLEQMLERYEYNSAVERVFPAYQAHIKEDTVRLVPVWVVELFDGEVDFLT
ncbi:hypothetical protein DUZ99_09785 [Xylanibacillus composti]|uniref:Regulatory protein YycH domain-containing protein n=1 Tax=Xylanibacillus composti TaxID=1572762 RepID=A0A8J4M3U6_9BACL|nr:two-component system activity regulator YycH [Xylanibacillus composti]MDT9725262.1 hypothetical protein [Xylanibacillus composti]GIQ70462.1 hypothetical protein XYCOK13_32860 [Xylanibacillus composti]